MLTAILLAYGSSASPVRPDAVARSLGSLVDACVQGLVADAVLVGPPGCSLEKVADEAGCALVEAANPDEGLSQALSVARQADVFLFLAAHAVERGFVDEVTDARAYGDPGKALVLRASPDSLVTRLAPRLAEPVGIIATRSALGAAGGADLRRLARRLRCAELAGSARRTC